VSGTFFSASGLPADHSWMNPLMARKRKVDVKTSFQGNQVRPNGKPPIIACLPYASVSCCNATSTLCKVQQKEGTMSFKASRASRAIGSFGRFFGEAVDSIARARLATEILNTPESVFERRGTTRDQAMRRIMDI
tara:strand:+ start:2309 stop:2713 length:405 start_codon:yes stop_codon:yes gene_type:complete